MIILLAVMALVGFVGCKAFTAADDTSGSASPPTITSVNPTTVTAGGPLFTLIVKGTGFVNDSIQSVVAWNGVEETTVFFSSSEVRAFIPAKDFANPGIANVTVNNKNTLDGTFRASSPATVTISSPAPPPSLVTVTFGNDALGGPPPGPPGSPLNGVYKNLDFGSGAWFWVDPALGLGPANAININSGPNPGAGDISFVNGPRLLLRIRVFPKRVGNVSITDSGTPPRNPLVTVVYRAADLNMVHFIETSWTLPTQKFAVGANIGYDLDIDTIVYEGPA